MNDFEKSCRRLLVGWCKHKASEERKLIGRCRTAYKSETLAHLTNRYADTLEQAAQLFDNLAKELSP